MIINPTSLADSTFEEIYDRAEGRFANYRRPWLWAANDWGLGKYRALYLEREMDCWRALCEGESVEDAQRIAGVEDTTVSYQTSLLARWHEWLEQEVPDDAAQHACPANPHCGGDECGGDPVCECAPGECPESDDDPMNDFNYVGSKHHY
jgi:hypothetical protein